MSFVKSETIKGRLTHWLKKEYSEPALNGVFNLMDSKLVIKPKGLWLSWNDGWEEWCKDNDCDWVNPAEKDCLVAELKPGLKLWLIDDTKDFFDVWHEYSPYNKDTDSVLSIYRSQDTKGINFWDWLKQTHKVDGVALTDQGQWRTRLTTWLYGWDCACILIFNPNNVILEKEKKEKKC